MAKRYYITIIVILISIGIIASSFGNYPIKPVKSANNTLINSSDRVMVIATHPDDEAISCAGVIRYCTENHIPLKIVVITDGYLSASPVKRHDESVNAMKILGVDQNDIIFLGYPDGTLPSLLTRNWNYSRPYRVNGTTNNSNYTYSYQENATYCGSNLAGNLDEIISKFNPTVIFYPDSEDEQIDHWATNAFVEYTTAQANYNGSKYTYIVHDPPSWPSPRTYNPETYLLPPNELSAIDYKWVLFPLDRYQERLKEATINTYTSQVNSDSYIQSFIRKNEIFGINPQIITIYSPEILNYFSSSDYPVNVIKEPKKNVKGKGSVRSREIIAAGFQMDNDNAWISLRTKKNISPTSTYEIHILALNSQNLERIDIKIHNGTANYDIYSDNSFHSVNPKLQIREDGLIIQIPSSALDNVNSFLMSADVLSGTVLIDWTGWREIEIER